MADDVAVAEEPTSGITEESLTVDTAGSEAIIPGTKTYGERISGLRGKAAQHYKLTGDVDAAEQMMTPAPTESNETQSGAVDAAQTETASDPAIPREQPKGRDRDWNKIREKASTLERDNIALKAKLEVYERERAGSRQSAPAATVDTAKPEASDERPDFPDIGEFNDQAKYKQAVKDWKKADSEWVERKLESRFTSDKQQQQYEHTSQKWNAQVTEARKSHRDFDDVASNPQVPITFTSWGVIEGLPDGALRQYALGKNLAEAKRIAELTHLPGEDSLPAGASLADFMKWVRSDPDRAVLYGRKLAAAESEISKLVTSKTKAAPPQKTLKEIIAGSNVPSAEVNVDTSATPIVDPIAEALKSDFPLYKKLKNEAELRDRKAGIR